MPSMKICPTFTVGVPTVSSARLTVGWAAGFRHLGMPLGSTVAEKFVFDTDVATARNDIVQMALELDTDYVFFLGDDVVPPGNALTTLWARNVDVVTGVYWTKASPQLPYLWRGYQKAPYTDWTAGEFFRIDIGGCDCLLVKTDVFRRMDPPWFSREWLFSADQPEPSPIATEDYYFYARLKEHGIDAWADTAVQCWHEDRSSGAAYGLTPDMPQATKERKPTGYEGKLIADYGSGPKTRGAINGYVVRYDLREEVKPDVRCDIRKIPEADQTFDVVFSNNVLEHFDYEEVRAILQEWIRTLKVGGELRVEVPNVENAMRNILAGKATEQDIWCLYGKPDHYDRYHHRFGFTVRGLKTLLESFPCLEAVNVEPDPTGCTINIVGTANKARHDGYKDLQPIYINSSVVEDVKARLEADGANGDGPPPAKKPKKGPTSRRKATTRRKPSRIKGGK